MCIDIGDTYIIYYVGFSSASIIVSTMYTMFVMPYKYPSSFQKFNTALHLAVESGSAGMVEALLTVPDINLGVLNEVKVHGIILRQSLLSLTQCRTHSIDVAVLAESSVQVLPCDMVQVAVSGYPRQADACTNMVINILSPRTPQDILYTCSSPVAPETYKL